MTKLFNQVNTLFNQTDNGTIWPAYNSYNSLLAKDQRIELVFHKHFDPNKSTVTLRETTQVFGTKKNLHSLTGAFIGDICSWVDKMYMTTNYRKVLQNSNWGKLFQVQSRSVAYIEGTTLKNKNEPTMPCYACGIVLPVGHITIDHHKPQAGGEHQAVLKNLRNMGYSLTYDPGKGGVARAYAYGNFQGNFQALPTKAPPPVLPTQSNEMIVTEDVVDDRKPHRYTLTDRGITFLSVAIAASSLQRVIDLSMHSAFNLKPYCAKCNIAKSNQLTDLSWIND